MNDTTETARELWSVCAGVVAVAVFGVTPVMAYIGNQGFAPLVALGGVGCLPLLMRDRRPNVGMIILMALMLWALASMLWSIAAAPHPDFSRYKAIEQLTALKLAPQFALYGAFALGMGAMSGRAAGRASLVLAIGLAAISLLFLAEAVFKAPLSLWMRTVTGEETRRDLAIRDLARVSYVLSLLFWPAALRFEQAGLRIAAALMAAATLIGAFLLGADAPFAALGVSTAVFLAVLFLGRPALLVMLAGIGFYFLAAPLLIQLFDHGGRMIPAGHMESWQARLDIWRFAAARIREQPFLGYGLDASRMFSPAIELHTHSAALQLWLELGAAGAALTTLFWAWVMAQLDRLEAVDRPMAAAAAAAASAYLTIGALSFGIWQEWWLALGALTAGVCAVLAKTRRAAAQAALP